jgi:hypothetical protein
MTLDNNSTLHTPTKMDQGAVSWGAIFAGASAAASLSLILLILGTGFGLSSVSPWSGAGISATTFGITTILWITFTQVLASGMGGYLAGRLRSRWAATHEDEVYFRDTAHGFLAWAVASLVTAALLTSAVSSIIGSTAKVAATGAASVSSGINVKEAIDGSTAYLLDSLFRAPNAPATDRSKNEITAEISRIFFNAVQSDNISTADRQYAAELVALRTGLPQAVADKRVTDTFNLMKTKMAEIETTAKQAADKARKASAYIALWLFISLLAGAFAASFLATFGGRRRDLEMKLV